MRLIFKKPLMTATTILVVVAALAIFANAAMAQGPLSVSAEKRSGKYEVTLNVAPEQSGKNGETGFIITVKDASSQPVSNLSLSIIAEQMTQQSGGSMGGMSGMSGMSGMQHSGPKINAAAKPGPLPGQYVAALKLSPDGNWMVTVAHGKDLDEFDVTVKQGKVQVQNPTHSLSTANFVEAAIKLVERAVGDYALTFSLNGHINAGEEDNIVVMAANRHTGKAVSGLSLELIPVHLMGTSGGDHGGGDMAMGDMGSLHEMSGMPNMSETGGALPSLSLTERKDAPGRYEARYTFIDPGTYLVVATLGGDQRGAVTVPVTVEDPHGEQAASGGPNYPFLGSLIGVVGISLLTVPVLRRRETAGQKTGADQA